MKALVLAAGRGERMRPLTDHTPKPLLKVRGKPLIEWHLGALARDGIDEVVINTAWLEEQLVATLGNGARFGLSIHYSLEGRDHGGALETAGGIAKALPWLGDAFWVVAGDVYTPQFHFDATTACRFARGDRLGHLWMVPNPPHHPGGDFGIGETGLATQRGEPAWTWCSIGLFKASIVDAVKPGTKHKLRPCLDAAIAAHRLGAERYHGAWIDVGTPERLAELNIGYEP